MAIASNKEYCYPVTTKSYSRGGWLFRRGRRHALRPDINGVLADHLVTHLDDVLDQCIEAGIDRLAGGDPVVPCIQVRYERDFQDKTRELLL